MSFSFSANLYNAINPYSSDICYYCGEMGYRVSRYNVCAEDLRSSLYHRNENNKFYFSLSSSGAMEVRIQLNIMWRESILRVRVLLSDGLLEMQAQVGVIIVVVVSDSEDDDDDDDKEWEEAAEVAKVNKNITIIESPVVFIEILLRPSKKKNVIFEEIAVFRSVLIFVFVPAVTPAPTSAAKMTTKTMKPVR